MIAVFITIVALFVGLLHLIIYEMAVIVFAVHSFSALLVIRISFIVLSLSFIVASVLASFYNNWATRAYYTASVIWLGLAVYLFLAAVVYCIAVWIAGFVHVDSELNMFGVILIFLSVLTVIYGIIHAKKIKVMDISVSLSNLPEFWQGKTAVWMSDLHLGQVNGRKFAAKVTALVNDKKPDIIFIGGDLFDGVKVDEKGVISPISKLIAPLGIYFITGNHEEFRDSAGFIDAIKSIGVKVLMNEHVDIEGLRVIGVDDRDSTNKEKFKEILARLAPGSNIPSILLKHQPDLLDMAESYGVSLQISGHTHRAQMFPLDLITKWIYHGYDYGLRSFKTMQVYTSSGTGTWGPPIRVGTDAEIVKIRFVRK
ncbi:MAG: metallophosphoesterase [Candidatus Pacebacteria bacterium]|nr:metallophosphoesterase [Candidatus Paceibacterota bacterium]